MGTTGTGESTTMSTVWQGRMDKAADAMVIEAHKKKVIIVHKEGLWKGTVTSLTAVSMSCMREAGKWSWIYQRT